MPDNWEVLEQAGVPIGAIRRRGTISPLAHPHRVLGRLAALPQDIEPALREPLLAWLNALDHHWPSRFDEIAGAGGRALQASLKSKTLDENRLLKLRRIAIENLADRL
jgi:hypothetical protein